jgi:hypothetical protein
VEVSSGEDDVPNPNASTNKKKVGDDAEDGGASSAEPIAPNQISSNAPEQTNPFIGDRVTSTNPSVGRLGHKCPPPIPK